MNLLAQDASASADRASGRSRLRRLLRPSLDKKFLLVFAILLATLVANWRIVDANYEKTRGMAAIVNVTGSLRWLSQRVYVETERLKHGDTGDRQPIDAALDRLDQAIRVLQDGGSVQGMRTAGLPGKFNAGLVTAELAVAGLRRNAETAISAIKAGQDAGRMLNRMYLDGTRLLEAADVLATTLAQEAEAARADTMENLFGLGVFDLALLLVTLMLVRMRIVRPLRALADLSQDFAEGRREARSGFRSRDEIGRLAAAFDGMADRIDSDIRQLDADAAELKRQADALRKLSLAVENSPVSIVITDAEGVIEYANPKFLEVYGYSAEEVVGRTPAMFKSGQMPAQLYRNLWQALRAGKEWSGAFLNRKKNGELFWEDTRIAPLKDAQGRVSHFIGVKKDISERRRAEALLAGAREELERRVAERTQQLTEANRELESFSYSVSHDLRAPLRAINGFAVLLAQDLGDGLKPDIRDYLDRIQRASVRMNDLIESLLELSRLSRHEIVPVKIDLGAMAQAIFEDLRHADPARRVETEVGERLLLQGDAALLRAVMENLIGNAWKYSSKRDPARIAVGCARVDGERAFYVRDNGAGFDMKYADKLFGAFQRLHGPQEFEGTGIGLAAVRRIIARHGGRVWAEAAPDAGATFYFTLPASGPDLLCGEKTCC